MILEVQSLVCKVVVTDPVAGGRRGADPGASRCLHFELEQDIECGQPQVFIRTFLQELPRIPMKGMLPVT